MIEAKQIENILQNQLNLLYNIIPEKQILGIFTYGKLNYGFAKSEKEIQTLFVYLPNYTELCSIEPNFKIKETIVLPNGQEIKKIDIRGFYNFASKQDSVMMEALFSEYQIINNRYLKAFKKFFFINKEIIFHCNPKERVKHIVDCGRNALSRYQNYNNVEDLFQACYLRIACHLYLDGASCENCINLKKDYHKSYLNQVLENTITPNLAEIYADFDSFEIESQECKCIDCLDLIKQGVQEILKIALTDNIQIEDFKNKLTDLENQALKVIIDGLEDGYEGIISVSQLVAASTISRPVFKSVLNKMKENLIAEVENKGVKGTYIKIIDGTLLSE